MSDQGSGQPERIAIILNPKAAGGRAIRSLPKVTAAARAVTPDLAIHVTEAPGDAWQKAREFAEKGYDRVIAVGGDGTFNEVANGIVESGRPVAMGVVPAGTGCDLPRSFKVPSDIGAATTLACLASPHSIDLGRVVCHTGESRIFVNVAGLGFDATVAERATRSRLPGAKLPYLTSLAASLAAYHNIDVVVKTGTTEIRTKAVFVTVANARYFGGGFMITPMASIDDGMLDLAIIGDLSVPELLRQIPNVYRGKHTGHPKFTHMLIESAEIITTENALVQADGELVGYAPATFTVLPGALRLAV